MPLCEFKSNRPILLSVFAAFVVVYCGIPVTATNNLDLANFADQQRGFTIGAESSGDEFGDVVGTGFSVNGDQFNDILIVAPQSKRVFVVFGIDTPTSFTVGNSFSGLTIFAGANVNANNTAAAFAGDVNIDGDADILIGFPFADGGVGVTYVVYGGQALLNKTIIELASLPIQQGYKIYGDESGAQCGNAIGGAGDVNGDRIADVIIGCKNASPVGRTNAGAVYVVYGLVGNMRSSVYLSDLHIIQGYRILGVENLRVGNSVATLGDLNNDGYADIAVSTDAISPSTSDIAVCVLYGMSSRSAEVDFSAAIDSSVGVLLYGGEGAYVVNSVGGSVTTQNSSTSDLLIGSFQSSYNGRTEAGIAYLVFGSTLGYTSELSNLGSDSGVILYGDRAGDHFGASVSTAGDVNQDGYMDVLIGAPQASASPQGLVRLRSGVVYLLYGSSNLANAYSIDMGYFTQSSHLCLNILGSTSMSYLGTSVGSAGDFNGDGFPDIVLGAPATASTYGEVYVLYGGEQYMSLTPTVSPAARPTFGSAPTTFQDLVVQDFPPASNRSLVFEGTLVNGQLGKALAIGDVNNDGRVDLILTVPYSANNAGQIYVLYGQLDDSNPFPNRDITALLPSDGFVITGRSSSYAGLSVSFLGDVNQDGFGDIIVGCLHGSPGGPAAAFVIFGTTIALRQPTIFLANFSPSLGFIITSSTVNPTSESFATSLSGAGDMNNDGYTDILIGDPAAKSAYVFLGAENLVDISIDLFEFGVSAGFYVRYPQTGDYVVQLGYSVQSAGDLNGDSYADIVIGSSGANYQWGERAWVVFGAEFLNNIEIGEPGALLRGFKMYGSFDMYVVSRAGDFNNDGFDDLIVGVPLTDSPPAYSNIYYNSACGVSYLLFGHSNEHPFPDLDLISFVSSPSLGFMIIGNKNGLRSGSSVAAAGDVNGDGIDDIIVGASFQSQGLPSRVYAIFGHTSTEYFGDIGVPTFRATAHGYRLLTSNYNDNFGLVLAAGDLNRDGLADILTSAPGAAVGVTSQAGRPVFEGSSSNDNLGYSVAAGDVNDDGVSDIILAAPYRQNGQGVIYVKYGGADVFNSTQLANMPPSQGFSVTGMPGGRCGQTVGFLGDTNGDGVGDFIVGCTSAAFVVYGSRSQRIGILLGNPGAAAIKIIGNTGYFGLQVGAAGDMNGDGLADFFVSDPYFSTGARVYVFFGTDVHADRQATNLAATGAGFFISASKRSYLLGLFATCLGDVNGDGYSDIVAGGQRFEPLLDDYKTVGAVIFGHNSSSVSFSDIQIVDESTVFNGYLFTLTSSYVKVNRAGDFNGDGFDDMLVGVSDREVFVLFGHSSAYPFAKVDLDAFSSSSFTGFRVFNSSSISGDASQVGDVNGDGIDDIMIGSFSSMAFACVLFGHTGAEPFADINLQYFRQQTRGFMIRQPPNNYGYLSVGVGDINNDGISDLLLGSPYRSVGNLDSAGTVFVVAGKYETPTADPTINPTPAPSFSPSHTPTLTPTTVPSGAPTQSPTLNPTLAPTFTPSVFPTEQPSSGPTAEPSEHPTNAPTEYPSIAPSVVPTQSPSAEPTLNPSMSPSTSPSIPPTEYPSATPSSVPTMTPSVGPTTVPTTQPSFVPSVDPTEMPTLSPSEGPTASPSVDPTIDPTNSPTTAPTVLLSADPSVSPTVNPTTDPSESPSSVSPTVNPTSDPTVSPSADPSVSPTVNPTTDPSASPSAVPSVGPTANPTTDPSESPSTEPSLVPTVVPTTNPSVAVR